MINSVEADETMFTMGCRVKCGQRPLALKLYIGDILRLIGRLVLEKWKNSHFRLGRESLRLAGT